MHPRHFIKQAMARKEAKGGLHRSLGVPEGQPIGRAKIESATHSSSPKVKKQAVLAENMMGNK